MWNRVRKTLIAFLCGQGLIAAEQLLLVPLFLVHWSAGTYGIWLSLSALVGFLGLLDCGMNTGAPTRLAQLYTQKARDRYRAEQHTAMGFYLLVAFAGTLGLTLFAFTLPVWRFLALQITPTPVVQWSLWWLGLQTLWAMPQGFLVLTFRTIGDMAKTQWFTNSRQLALIAATVLALLSGADMAGVAAAEFGTLAVFSGAVWLYCRRAIPNLIPGLSQASRASLPSLLRPSLNFWVANLAQVFGQNLPVLIVRAAIGDVAVAVLVVSRTAAMLIRQAIVAAHNALWPELTHLEALGEPRRLRDLHRLVCVGSSATAIAAIGILWVFGDTLLHIWTRGRLPSDPWLLRLWLIYLAIHLPWLSSALFLQAANRVERFSRASAYANIAGLLLTGLLIRRFGSWAVPLGFIAGEALFCTDSLMRQACQSVGESYGRFARWFWRGWLTVLGGTLGIAWLIERFSVQSGPFHWLLLSAVILSAALLLARSSWDVRRLAGEVHGHP